ncbi:MAG: hypothetical protein ACLR5I_09755 [Odoribacter splanchnicus]
MNRIFYILVICCQAFGVSAQSVADAGLFTYSAAGTVTASLGGNGVAWGPDAFAVFRNSAQGPWLMRRLLPVMRFLPGCRDGIWRIGIGYMMPEGCLHSEEDRLYLPECVI